MSQNETLQSLSLKTPGLLHQGLFVQPTDNTELYVGRTIKFPSGGIYGGQLVAQACLAAEQFAKLNVDQPSAKPLQSIHLSFLEAGRLDLPVIYRVEVLRQGRVFTTLEVSGFQSPDRLPSDLSWDQLQTLDVTPDWLNTSAKRLIKATLLLQFVDEAQPQHQLAIPDHVPGPEQLLNDDTLKAQWWQQGRDQLIAWFGDADKVDAYRAKFFTPRPVEVRPLSPRNPLLAPPPPSSSPKVLDHTAMQGGYWFRFVEPGFVDHAAASPERVRAALAYVSDHGLLATAMVPHQLTFFDPGLKGVSLDHAMWFHRDCDLSGWFLYHIETTNLSRSRGMSRGYIYRASGELIASTAQEGLLRLRSRRS